MRLVQQAGETNRKLAQAGRHAADAANKGRAPLLAATHAPRRFFQPIDLHVPT